MDYSELWFWVKLAHICHYFHTDGVLFSHSSTKCSHRWLAYNTSALVTTVFHIQVVFFVLLSRLVKHLFTSVFQTIFMSNY